MLVFMPVAYVSQVFADSTAQVKVSRTSSLQVLQTPPMFPWVVI